MRTHYETLGLPQSATPEQIRRAYRAHAKALHPDVNASKDATRAFARIAGAYEVLSDPDKRRAYDRSLAAKAARSHQPPDRHPSDVRQGHYTWVNVAAPPADTDRDISEIDELYDTFFHRPTRPPASGSAPKPAREVPKHHNGHSKPKTQGKPKQARRRSS